MARMPTLYDHRGRPIQRRVLRDELTAPSIAGVRNILTSHPASGITPEKLAALLRAAETPGGADRYLELAEEMEERDLHYVGVLQTRKRQVAQIGVTVEPADDRAEATADADLVRTFFEREELEDELFDVLDSVGKGFSVTEIVWEMSENQWMPARLEWRLPQWFDFDREGGRFLVRRPDQGGEWMELEPWKYVTHQTRAKSGLPVRGGLARIAAWAWLFKSLTLKDWMRFCEAYGMPIRVGRYHPTASPEDKEVLWKAVANLAPDLAAIFPDSMMIEFPEQHQVQARAEIYRDLVQYIDSQVSIAVLGQTLTTQEGDSGSYSLGQVHDRVRGDIERSDGRQLAATLHRDLVVPIVQLNHGMRGAYPKVTIEREETMDMQALGEILPKLVPLGLPVGVDEVLTRLGLKRPDEKDDVLTAPTLPDPGDEDDAEPGPPEPRQDMARVILALARSRDRDAVDDAVAAAMDDWRPLVDPTVRPLLDAAREHVESGGDLAAFRRKLPELFDGMDDSALAGTLRDLAFSGRASERGDGR